MPTYSTSLSLYNVLQLPLITKLVLYVLCVSGDAGEVSVEHDGCPVQSGCVRGNNDCSGWVIEPMGKNSCMVVVVFKVGAEQHSSGHLCAFLYYSIHVE